MPSAKDTDHIARPEAGRQAHAERVVMRLDGFTVEAVRRLPGVTMTERISDMCRRYAFFRDAAVAQLVAAGAGPQEWAFYVLALRDVMAIDEFDTWRTVAWWAHTYRKSVIAGYGVDPVPVAEQLRDLGEAANIAVRECVERYWALPGSMGHADRLLFLGLIDKKQAAAWPAIEARVNARMAEIAAAEKGRKSAERKAVTDGRLRRKKKLMGQ